MSDDPKKVTALTGPVRPNLKLVEDILCTNGTAPVLRLVGDKDEKGFFIFRWSGREDRAGTYLIYDGEQDVFIGILRRDRRYFAEPTPLLYPGRKFRLIRLHEA